MLYRIISNIHSELWPESEAKALKLVDLRIPPMDGDAETTLLLPGDTGSYRRRVLYGWIIEHLCARFKAVYDIPGNHYWYGGTDWGVIESPALLRNYRFGHTLDLGKLVGATLWADFQRENPLVMERCRIRMNDFRQVPGLTPGMVLARHREQVAFLREHIQPGGIVLTHFAPSWQSISPEYAGDELNGYYATDLEDLILEKRPALWVHGHMHTRFDYMVGGTRVICDPAGYEGRDHDPLLRVEVPMTDQDYAAELKRYIRPLQAELKTVEGRAGKLPAPDPISDHAVVRYLERVKFIDMRRLRAEILPHERRGLLATAPGKIKCGGYDLICARGVVVTVI